MFFLRQCHEGGLCGLDVEVEGSKVQIKCPYPEAKRCKEHNQRYHRAEFQNELAKNNFVMRPSRQRLAEKGVVPQAMLATPNTPAGPIPTDDDLRREFGTTGLADFYSLSALGILSPAEALRATRAVAEGRAPDNRPAVQVVRGELVSRC